MYFETEQASVNTTEKTQSAAAQLSHLPTNDLTFPPVDFWGRAVMRNECWVWPEVEMRGRASRELRSAQSMRQKK